MSEELRPTNAMPWVLHLFHDRGAQKETWESHDPNSCFNCQDPVPLSRSHRWSEACSGRTQIHQLSGHLPSVPDGPGGQELRQCVWLTQGETWCLWMQMGVNLQLTQACRGPKCSWIDLLNKYNDFQMILCPLALWPYRSLENLKYLVQPFLF